MADKVFFCRFTWLVASFASRIFHTLSEASEPLHWDAFCFDIDESCVCVCICVQVRCAAVFALGTFVGNSAERTDHSTTIDHNVAMMLAQLINDGSPVVRKVTPRSPFLLHEDRRRMLNATACVCRRDAGLSAPVENVFSCAGKKMSNCE